MSYSSIDITGQGAFGLVTFNSPRMVGFNINANEFAILSLTVVTNRAGTLMPAQPGVMAVETSSDGGLTWRAVPGTLEPITGVGSFMWNVSYEAGTIFPLCRAICTVPINDPNCFYVVDSIYQNKLSSNEPAFIKTQFSGTISASTGFNIDGVPTGVEEDTVTPSNSQPLPTKMYVNGNVLSSSNPLPITTSGGQLVDVAYDEAVMTIIDPSTENWDYKSLGVTVATVQVTYNSPTKQRVISAKRI
jgi:hypothetical protein